MAKGQIRARIQCTVDIPVGRWAGGQTDLDALADQVRKEGIRSVEKMLHEQHGSDAAIVGVPKVVFVVLQEDNG